MTRAGATRRQTTSRSEPRTTQAGAPSNGRARVTIDSIRPWVDLGRHPIKRAAGETVRVVANAFCDGHDQLDVRLLFKHADEQGWQQRGMAPLGNDLWEAEFEVDRLGRYLYTVEGGIDRFSTWRRDLQKRHKAGQDIRPELAIGARIVHEAAERADGHGARKLRAFADLLEAEEDDDAPEGPVEIAFSRELARIMRRHSAPYFPARHEPALEAVVEPAKAVFSAWYEMFPRSAAPEPGRHGTFEDVEARLPYVAELGFDVLYLPPIHPIGRTNRKGPNNSVVAGPDDPGSPWAIGSEEGGHTAIHPELGSLEDFRRLVAAARDHEIDIALDIAFQTSPDHPWVADHPEWFHHRPDGTIRCAENPPKVYEDIYPIDFETEDWWALWQELRSVFEFWIQQGVSIFRVDNPHTKSLRFWEWCIAEIKADHPEAIFLAEAFTRPSVMHGLAKIGFSQSYTYFPWRNSKRELRSYLTELTDDAVLEYFRPNHWPNTPDILTEFLQHGGRPACMARLVLAATLGASYGIYGPAFELVDNRPVRPESEEYLDSEKYQIRRWDLDAPHGLRHLIARVNRIRRENPALHSDRRMHFHHTDNDALLCYSKTTAARDNAILVVVNLDPHHVHNGWVHVDLDELGVPREGEFQVHDLLSDTRFVWSGSDNYVEVDPGVIPAHVFRVRRRIRTEEDFDYYL